MTAYWAYWAYWSYHATSASRAERSWCERPWLVWKLAKVTPKNIYFYYIKKYFLDQSIQKTFNLILKNKSLHYRRIRSGESSLASFFERIERTIKPVRAYRAYHETSASRAKRSWCESTLCSCQLCRHGAEQCTGYLEFILYGYDLDSAIPRMSDAVYCLTPSLQLWHVALHTTWRIEWKQERCFKHHCVLMYNCVVSLDRHVL